MPDKIIAFVLSASERPGLQFIRTALAGHPDAEIKTGATKLQSTEPQPIIVVFRGVPLIVMAVEAPVPDGDVAPAAYASRQWPEAATTVRRHRSHLVVSSIIDDVEAPVAVRAAGAVTAITEICCDHTEALAVLWGPTGILNPPGLIREANRAIGEQGVSIELWTQFAAKRQGLNPANTIFFSQGLATFLDREIELTKGNLDDRTALARLIAFARFLLSSGARIDDGDTIGVSLTDKLLVRLKPRGTVAPTPIYAVTAMAAGI